MKLMKHLVATISATRTISCLVTLVFAALLTACGGGGGNPGTSSGASAALFTSAPSPLTLLSGTTSLSYNISGGVAPYTVNTDTPALLSASVNGSTFTISATVGSSGSGSVSIADSKGIKVAVLVTVPASSALFSTAPSNLTLAIGTISSSYSITGGVAPYTVTSTNPGLVGATVPTGSSSLTISALTGTSGGAASVIVSDSKAAQLTIGVTVLSPTALFSTAPATLQILSGTTDFYTIFGGTAPYVVNSGNNTIARAVLSGTSLAISGLVPGNQTVAISDAKGAVIAIDVTVNQGLYTDAPANLSVASGTGATYTIFGGIPYSGTSLYRVNSSKPAVASATVTGSILSISGVSVGSTSLVISDSVGATRLITVTVPEAGALMSTAPSSLQLATGTSGVYAISGGVGPYTATSANPVIVSASTSGSLMTIGAVADTVGGTANVVVTDSVGTPALTISVTASPVKFFTTAPAQLSISAGSSKIFAVFGGSLPYSVVNTHPAVAVGVIVGSTLTITGDLTGSGTVMLSDAKGVTYSIAVVVNAAGTLSVSAPGSVVIATGSLNAFEIIGGVPPYFASSSNTAVVAASIYSGTGSDNRLYVTAIGTGSAVVAVTDSAGSKVTISVTAGTAAAPLFVSAPATLNMGAGTVANYLVSGGTNPYNASSSDIRIATASIGSAGTLTVNALSVGTATLLITDALGASFTITVKVDGTSTGPSAVASIDILASSNSLNSAPGSSISFIVTVKDAVNAALPSQMVSFTASSGTLAGTNPTPTTNAAGTISTVTLSPGADASNRNIVVTAIAGTISKTITIPVVGTTITVSGPGAALVGSAAQNFTIKAVDSGGKPIVGATLTFASAVGNGVSPSTVTTDSSGAATVAFTAAVVGTDTLTASGLGTSGTASVIVSNVDFGFIAPTAGALLPVSSANLVTVRYRVAGVGVAGQTVTFGSTRGTLSATTAITTAPNGDATVSVSSLTAGPVTVSAQLGTARSSLTAAFVATVPASMVLQVNPAAVLPNASGTTNQSALTAIVRDAVGNPVQGVVVNFAAVTDGSNGSIAPGSATTDANGLATAQFIPGPLSTAANGVQIRATVQANPSITSTAVLTVNGSALFISIARSGTLTAFDSTTYQKDFSVYVTDANGAPAGNRAVTLSVDPITYGKGQLVYNTTSGKWVYASGSPTTCINEDANRNGILDAGDIDQNFDGRLQPGIPAVITSSVTTDALGFGTFTLRYGKNYAWWVSTQITAKSLVGGTESRQTQLYDLEMTAADNASAGTPANVVSPFGTATVCSNPN